MYNAMSHLFSNGLIVTITRRSYSAQLARLNALQCTWHSTTAMVIVLF